MVRQRRDTRWLMSCREATRLVSESLDRPLSLKERLALQVHLFTCRNCMRYQSQIRRMRRAVDDYAQEQQRDGEGPVLSSEARRCLQSRIERVLKSSR